MAEQITLQALYDTIRSVQREVHEIKEAVVEDDEENELTDWAKEELAKARAEPIQCYTPHEELKKRILEK